MNNLDYYLNSKGILSDVEITDVTGGLNPIYYYLTDKIYFSSSVFDLIRQKGFKKNPNFKFAQEIQFVDGFETVDSEIFRLKPFETVTLGNRVVNFHPIFKNKNIPEFLSESAKLMTEFVNGIESQFPGKKHLILTGGKDSRIIYLIKKLHPENWKIFSSQPDYYYVRDWLTENNFKEMLLTHDGFYDENYELFKQKVIASDGMVDLRHARWVKQQIEMAKDTIFWIGDTGLIFSPNVFCKKQDKRDYFDELLPRISNYHGTKNQMIFNLASSPRLSPYFSPKLLRLYEQFDFSVIDKDYRNDLANIIARKKIIWENPYQNINCYRYPFEYDIEKIYLEAICLK